CADRPGHRRPPAAPRAHPDHQRDRCPVPGRATLTTTVASWLVCDGAVCDNSHHPRRGGHCPIRTVLAEHTSGTQATYRSTNFAIGLTPTRTGTAAPGCCPNGVLRHPHRRVCRPRIWRG